MTEPSIWFVTPAYKRYELTALCLEQRSLAIEVLSDHGIEAHCVVVADDDNLDIARSFGFSTVETPNRWLGKKFNDGMEYAGRHGADWIVPIGSDSWIHPNYFLPMPATSKTRTSRAYCAVTHSKMAQLIVGGHGAGPYVLHRDSLKRFGFRPAANNINKSVDGSTLKALGRLKWEKKNFHELQYVGFRGKQHITSYGSLVSKWGNAVYVDHWDRLAAIYPEYLVERVKENSKDWLVL